VFRFIHKRHIISGRLDRLFEGFRCFCCFCRKLSASGNRLAAEILARGRFGEANNSGSTVVLRLFLVAVITIE
jgi:hypothetical protein